MMTPSWFKQWGQHRKRRYGEAPRVVRGRGPTQSHGMGRQETWEVLSLPAGEQPDTGREPEDQDSRPDVRLAGRRERDGEHEQASTLRTRLTNQ